MVDRKCSNAAPSFEFAAKRDGFTITTESPLINSGVGSCATKTPITCRASTILQRCFLHLFIMWIILPIFSAHINAFPEKNETGFISFFPGKGVSCRFECVIICGANSGAGTIPGCGEGLYPDIGLQGRLTVDETQGSSLVFMNEATVCGATVFDHACYRFLMVSWAARTVAPQQSMTPANSGSIVPFEPEPMVLRRNRRMYLE